MIRTPDIALSAIRNGNAATVDRWAREMLPDLVSDDLPAPAVRHPLDFSCVPLHRGRRQGLCLHVWPDGCDPAPTVHAHSWDLWSHVLHGTVLNQVMSVRDDDEAPESRVYEVRTVEGVDSIRATGRTVSCVPQDSQEVHAGQIYRLSAGLFHWSGHRGLTATIVLAEHHKELGNLVLGDLDGDRRLVRPRSHCSAEEVRALLRLVFPR
jgi:hypothetical protein